MVGEWVIDYQDPRSLDFTEHLNGIAWYEAPPPRRWHKHKAQTRAFLKGERIHRCACGAFSRGDRSWFLLDPPRRAGKP